ncbi:hypothetical protein [Streptacidiphilus sp. ASG 303]|uniref:hypothetical protein n=1 Tax=Streptomycetaceae TaxID=2062 RepID=UPI001E4CFD6D|nr:hypothetical protein [Streptacidiphilus sp. ASG 303]MCD0485029.1 hypothetical protein [Streptacidiphilus sp. ASG 303]
MSAAEAAGRRVEEALDRLAADGGPAAAAAGEDLVRALTGFYGAGLARAVALLSGPDGALPPALLEDDLVSALLVLHDLHPEDTAARVGRALRAARAATAVEVESLDEAEGVLRLAPREGGGCGCPSTAEATRQRIEEALACFAPEVAAVELRPAGRQPALLQIGSRPAGAP